MADCDEYVSGFYYNIYLPVERQNKCEPDVAGARSAVVYDEQGKLVDSRTQPELYQKRLEKRKTASDHFLNVVIFHD